MKPVRQNLYLDPALSERLEQLAARPGANKSKIVNAAVQSWLERQGAKELDALFKPRLDRISRDLAIARRDIDILLEAVSLFVRYQLTVTAPLPESDAAAIAVGEDRYNRFIGQLGRQISNGRRALKSLRGEEAA